MPATKFGLLGEQDEFEEEAMELEPLFGRLVQKDFRHNASRALELETAPIGVPIPGTKHRLTGCPPNESAQRVNAVRQAVILAIRLADNAAKKVRGALNSPRNKVARDTARFYLAFFGHDPSSKVHTTHGQPSGVSVAWRFQEVANALKDRGITFRCVAATCPAGATHSSAGDATHHACCRQLSRAFWSPSFPSFVHLCPPFWDDKYKPEFRGATILHEMLHMLFADFLGDEGRRANAHCYKAFSLRVAGYGREIGSTCACWDLKVGPACRKKLGIP